MMTSIPSIIIDGDLDVVVNGSVFPNTGIHLFSKLIEVEMLLASSQVQIPKSTLASNLFEDELEVLASIVTNSHHTSL